MQRFSNRFRPVSGAGPKARLTVFLLVGLAVLAGCATPPPATDPEALAEYKQTNDPLEPTNRVLYSINNAVDTYALVPVARGYRVVVPEFLRDRVHNILANLQSPMILSNDMMQGKPRRAGDTLVRMLVNSTAGVGGMFDVAEKLGYPAHSTDFGITMALWGVDPGPYLFLPVLGPSDPRDGVGEGIDVALDPTTYVSGASWRIFDYTRYGMTVIDTRERLLDPIRDIKKTALDPYATFRSLYRQNRESEITRTRDDNRLTIPDWYALPAQ